MLRLEGSGSRTFLQGQTSADVQQAEEGDPLPACWLDATGRVQALLEILMDATGADVLVLAGAVDAVSQGFDRVIFPADRVRLKGTRQQRRQELLVQGQPMEPVNVCWTDDEPNQSDRFPASEAANTNQLDRWRLEQGWPLGAGELDGTTNPFELGLSPWVHLNKGCYLGQETVAKLASKGEVKQQLRSWRALSSDLQGTHPERGSVLRRQGDRAGVITSAVEIASADGSPQEWIGLALVRRQALADPQLTLDGDQGTIQLFKPQAFSEPPSRA
ncbi:MAG: glycine cleavage system protein T [Synechococcales cyanobacterium H12SWP_bin.12]|nr:glycine cleavage system protein T [Synechococcales cyanobacterium H12SWP_bin.12]